MDLYRETSFVNKYIKKEFKDRLLFELRSIKKRSKAISRFAHRCEELLQNSYTKHDTADLQRVLSITTTSEEQCYIISDNEHDCEVIALPIAIEYCKESYMPFILIGSSFAMIKPENESGTPVFYIFRDFK